MKPITLLCLLLCMALVKPCHASGSKLDLFYQYLDSLHVTCKAETDRYAWYGTPEGLYFVQKKNNKVFHLTSSNSVLPANRITAIQACPNGEVFIGTPSGLVRYDNFSFLLINQENSALPNNDIRNITAGRANEVLIYTADTCITSFTGSDSHLLSRKKGILASKQ